MNRELTKMKESLQNALDEISSPRIDMRDKTKGLKVIEQVITSACVPTEHGKPLSDQNEHFLALQYTFECNIQTRLLPWLATSTLRLELLTNRGSMDDEQEVEAIYLASQLSLALSLIQGVALNHNASKAALGRKYALEIFLDLLLASRHLSAIAVPNPGPNSENHGSHTSVPPLSSVILDTLLCILVDSSQALRAFEEVQGVQAVVKILKRAGTPREVRMKCLEFLYFYLMDESPTSATIQTTPQSVPQHPVAPSTPQSRMSLKKLYVNGYSPNLPSSRMPSISSSIFPSSELSSASSRSNSTSSSHSSQSSTSSISATSVSSAGSGPFTVSKSPDQPSALQMLQTYTRQQQQRTDVSDPPPANPKTPPQSPQSPLSRTRSSHTTQTPSSRRTLRNAQLQLQTKQLHMFNRDVDYTPLSPKKPSIRDRIPTPCPLTRTESNPGPFSTPLGSHNRMRSSDGITNSLTGAIMNLSSQSGPGHSRGKSLSTLGRGGSLGSVENIVDAHRDLGPAFVSGRSKSTMDRERDKENLSREDNGKRQHPTIGLTKTTEQKKEYLGTMLGNVDALVEGVRKAGIWGLG